MEITINFFVLGTLGHPGVLMETVSYLCYFKKKTAPFLLSYKLQFVADHDMSVYQALCGTTRQLSLGVSGSTAA